MDNRHKLYLQNAKAIFKSLTERLTYQWTYEQRTQWVRGNKDNLKACSLHMIIIFLIICFSRQGFTG